MTRWRVVTFAGVLACADTDGPTGANGPGITPVSRAAIRDTVLARITSPLEVEVRGEAGALAPGIVVEFSGLPAVRDPNEPSAFVGSIADQRPVPIGPALDTTDSRGRAAARVVLGSVAGPGGVVVRVSALGLLDTIPVDVLHGHIISIAVVPADTAVYVGRSYTLRAHASDRWGNSVDTTAVYGGVSGGVTVSAAGVVTGTAISRAAIAYRVGDVADSVHASVVPVGTIAAHVRRARVGDQIGVAVVNLDGSAFRRVAVETPPRSYGGEEPAEHETAPRWNPAGTTIAYQESRATESGTSPGFDQKRLHVTDLAGPSRPVFDASAFYTDGQPDWSADGASIYFVGRRASELFLHIWRVRADGSGPAPLGGVADNVFESRPAVSPDGQWIAYVDAADYSGYSGALHVVRPDGGGDRRLAPGAAYQPVVDWSPDGRFIIAGSANYGVLELIDVVSSARIPLPYASRLSQPAWQPGSSR